MKRVRLESAVNKLMNLGTKADLSEEAYNENGARKQTNPRWRCCLLVGKRTKSMGKSSPLIITGYKAEPANTGSFFEPAE